ncbi:Pyruvate dehydrogenase complex protein X component, mitochondrial, partial [Tolypocladium paradoxum]
ALPNSSSALSASSTIDVDFNLRNARFSPACSLNWAPMASLTAACRASARLVSSRAAARGFTSSARCPAAHNFIMPALSPTMTEGNIASWKVKEGDTFSAGDVLLEIETDKATMDVEAQDDGVVMKIMSQDGSKAVQVGTRIAVLAESGDDVSALEIPADEKQAKQAGDEAAAPTQSESNKPAGMQRSQAASGGTHEQRYPLMPAVEHLVKQNGLGKDEVSKIKPTGPSGRLLKGDVLAFLGTINADTPAAVSLRFEKLAHLDLSNIKVAENKAPAPAPKQAEAAPEAPEAQALEINVPVSLAKVIEVQKKIQDTLGVFLPLSTFISRAAEVANDELPLAARKPTPGELFDQVLGLDKVKAARGSRGVYLPQISAIPPASMLAPRQPRPSKGDIIDELAGPSKTLASRFDGVPTVPGLSSGTNVFSLVVPKEEEQRAHVFLERCKLILEKEPGRLVL